jgi:SNF2 family DNA or RNA helicase
MTQVWHDRDTNSLVYHQPDERMLTYVQGARRVVNGYVACPANLYNLQVLSVLGLPVIPPVGVDYSWPISRGLRPRDHQRVMTNFMVLNPKCFNLSDMGTMKTLATLWAADYVMTQNPGWKTLIVCPVSIMQRVWADAITSHFLGRRKCVLVRGDAKKRLALLAEPADFYIINFDGVGVGAEVAKRKGLKLGGLSHELARRTDIAVVVIDEAANAYRSGGSRRSRVARAVLVPKPYLWALTGTPLPNGPLDAHGLARLVNGASGESYNSYQSRVMYQVSQYKFVPRRGAYEEAYKLLQPSIRFEMRECTDVPPFTEQLRDVELSAEQAGAYKRLRNDLVLDLAGGTKVTAAHEAALRQKLIQISCGAIYDHDHNVTRLDCAPRLAVLREVIEEAKRKVIIFAPLTSVIHLLYDDLKEYSRAKIIGDTPAGVRDAIIQAFQTEADPQLLIADPGCMAHGVDLFAANVCVWYGPTDRHELYFQGNRRIDRPGQTVPTTAVQLAATDIEREIYRRAANNQSMQGLVMQMVRDGA